MFVARAGLNTRRYEGQSGLTALLAPKKKTGDQKFYCWVPCMLGPCIGGIVGLVILLGGAAMCTTGYYAKHFSSSLVSNGTHIVTQVDRSKEFHMYNMTFVGPVIMGCGCFVIIIACVVVCEQRDKDIRIKAEAEKLQGSKKNKKKKEFYNAVVKRLKKSQVYNNSFIGVSDSGKTKQEQQPKKSEIPPKKFKFMPCLDQAGSQGNVRTPGQYSYIGGALRNIPLEIFSVDIEHKQGSTLLPVRVKSETHLKTSEAAETNKCSLHKYPSAVYMHELVRLDDGTNMNGQVSKETSVKSASDSYLDQPDQKESMEEYSSVTNPDSPMVNCDSEMDISEVKHSTGQDIVVINMNRRCTSNSVNSLPTCDHSLTSSSDSLFPCDNQSDHSESQVIQCQVYIHTEQQETKQDTTGDQANLNNAQHEYRENPHRAPEESGVDTQVLAITSGIARANAAGMDLFKKNSAKQQRKLTKNSQDDSTVVASEEITETSPQENEPAGMKELHGDINTISSQPMYTEHNDSEKHTASKTLLVPTTDERSLSTPLVQGKHATCEIGDKRVNSDNELGYADNTVRTNGIELCQGSTDSLLTAEQPSVSENNQFSCDMEKSTTTDDDPDNVNTHTEHHESGHAENRQQDFITKNTGGVTLLRIESCDTLQTESCVPDNDTDETNNVDSYESRETQDENLKAQKMCTHTELKVVGSSANPPQWGSKQDIGDMHTSRVQETNDGSETQVEVISGDSNRSTSKAQCSLVDEDQLTCVDI